MKYIFIVAALFVCSSQFTLADNVYLITGYVYRNVAVLDTTNSWVRLVSAVDTTTVRLSYITHIEREEVDFSKAKVFELYSTELYKAFTDSTAALALVHNKQREDSLTTHLKEYKKIFPLYNKLYLEAAGGVPNVFVVEAAYTIRDYISLGLYVGIKNNFSDDILAGFTSSIYLPSFTNACKPLVHISFNKFTASGAIGMLFPLNEIFFVTPSCGLAQYYKGFDDDKYNVSVKSNFFWSIGLAAVFSGH
jgi:hypothetical protein